MGQTNSRALVHGPPVIPNSTFPVSTASYNFINPNNMLVESIDQPVLFPQSEGGNPVSNFVYSVISSPFQIVQWGNPFNDEYIVNATVQHFDMSMLSPETLGKYMMYTYLYTSTGWTAFSGGNALSEYENPTIDCRGCPLTQYPNIRTVRSGLCTMEVTTRCSVTESHTSIINLQNINTYIFIQSQSHLYTEWDLSCFQAHLNAYIAVINQIELFVGINPFCAIEYPTNGKTMKQSVLSLQFTYPFMIYAQLILLDCFPATSQKYWSILNLAIDFVSKYSRSLWTIDGTFDYEYTQREYLSMYNRRWLKHKEASLSVQT